MGLQETLAKLGGQQGHEGGMASIQKLFGANGMRDIVSKLSSSGFGPQVQSWVGTGVNQPISSAQVQQTVDPATLQQVSQRSGMTPEEVSNHVAQALPDMVDKATPNGEMPAEDPLSKGISMLKNVFKR
jgi:uncharacterized protein YidB (DUF937 family)